MIVRICEEGYIYWYKCIKMMFTSMKPMIITKLEFASIQKINYKLSRNSHYVFSLGKYLPYFSMREIPSCGLLLECLQQNSTTLGCNFLWNYFINSEITIKTFLRLNTLLNILFMYLLINFNKNKMRKIILDKYLLHVNWKCLYIFLGSYAF